MKKGIYLVKGNLIKMNEKEVEEVEEALKIIYKNPISKILFEKIIEFAEEGKQLEDSKNQAYWERNQLLVLLSKIYPSHLCEHPDDDLYWDAEWRWIVCIHIPNSQATWHIHDSEKHFFDHLEIKDAHWDGHTTKEKYERIKNIKNDD